MSHSSVHAEDSFSPRAVKIVSQLTPWQFTSVSASVGLVAILLTFIVTRYLGGFKGVEGGEESQKSLASVEERSPLSEEDILRNYVWGKGLKPHGSLRAKVNSLTKEEKRTLEWLRRSRKSSEALSKLDRIPNSRASKAPLRGLPGGGDGPGVWNGEGVYKKYAKLLEEWQTGVESEKSQLSGAQWREDYSKLHSQIISGALPPRIMEFTCATGQPCGGLSDRLLGLVTTFMSSNLSDRAFIVNWEHPCAFDLLFDSPNVNWITPWGAQFSELPETSIFKKESLSTSRQGPLDSTINWGAGRLDAAFPSKVEEWRTSGDPWIRITSNRGMVFRSFHLPSLRVRLDEMGLNFESSYQCFMNFLLRPKPTVLDYVRQYTTFFSLPSVFSIAIQIRTGDCSISDPTWDEENTVAFHSNFFRTAEQVATAHAHPTQRVVYYLVTDSDHLRKDALRAYPDRVIVTGLEIIHLETHGDGKQCHPLERLEGNHNAIAEQRIIAGTDFQVLTGKSAFGRIRESLF